VHTCSLKFDKINRATYHAWAREDLLTVIVNAMSDIEVEAIASRLLSAKR